MNSPHHIRLQGPWQIEIPAATGGEEITTREVKLPAPWAALFGNRAGTAIFRRNFNQPTNLSAEDRVFIRLPAETGDVMACTINGKLLSASLDDAQVYEISDDLQSFNQLAIQIEFIPDELPAERGGLWQPVLLEIVSAR